MAKDPRLWKRNLLVIPGGLLAFYGALGLLYLLAYHKAPAAGLKATHVCLRPPCPPGAYYDLLPGLAVVLLVGLVLVALGLALLRSKRHALAEHLDHGTPVHFGLALLLSWLLLPVVAMLYYAGKGAAFVLARDSQGNPLRTVSANLVFGLLALVALMALVPYSLLYAASAARRRRFLHEAEAYEEPAPFPGEPALAAPPPPPPPSAAPPPAAAPMPPPVTSMEGFAEVPDPAPPPLEPGTKEWEIVTEEPAEPTPREARAPIVQQSAGCRAMKPTGQECGNPVGPGGRYCLKHACQGRTASGAPCRNPAMEGSTRCRAHMVE